MVFWEEFLSNGQQVLLSLQELAKYYEHGLRDYNRAVQYTERALKYIDLISELQPDDSLTIRKREFKHRLNRLWSKINRNVSGN